MLKLPLFSHILHLRLKSTSPEDNCINYEATAVKEAL